MESTLRDTPATPGTGPGTPWEPTRRAKAVVALATFLFALAFALYTRHAWEDWYITFRASKNLATGGGLVFTIGQRVHSFTSPIGTLLPALLSWLTGAKSDDLVLWLFRLVNCGLLACAAVWLLDIGRRQRLGRTAVLFMVAVFAVDAKIVDFSINGMETGITIFFLVLTMRVYASATTPSAVPLAIAWAGLMWTRPDAFVYIVATAAGHLLFVAGRSDANTRSEASRTFVRAALIAAVVYLPWTVWTTIYYGTPIPHTIVAKGLLVASHGPSAFALAAATFPLDLFFSSPSVTATFAPPYYGFGGWNGHVLDLARLVALIAALYWVVPGARPMARAASFAAFVSHFYLSCIVNTLVPWYVPSVAVLSIIVLGHLVQDVLDRVAASGDRARRRGTSVAARGVGAAALAVWLGVVCLTVATAYQLRFQERVIERDGREQIGRWLASHADSKGDTVFLECLGYIGFYSQLKMFDWPGMSSPEMVAARRELQSDAFGPLILKLDPKWLVLRPHEVAAIHRQTPGMLPARYDDVKVFNHSDEVRARRWLPGRPYLEYDAIFTIFKRKPVPPAGVEAGTGK